MNKIANFFRRIRQDNKGVAFIEFAFAAPIFVVLVVVGLETVHLAIAYMRTNQMAMTVADNAGRVKTGIDEANVHEVFAGANLVGSALDFEKNGRVILYSLEENGQSGSNAGQKIGWQRCWGDLKVEPSYGYEGDGKIDATLAKGLGPVGRRITAASGTAVMFVEVTYEYQPLMGTGFFDPPTIRMETAYNVRGRQNNVLTNTQGLSAMKCK